MKNLAHGVYLDNVQVAKVLPKDNEFVFDAVELVLEDLDVVDTLLQFLVVFLFECVNVEHEEMAIEAANPCEVLVHPAAKEAVPAGFLHDYCAQILVIHMELVTFASREDHTRVVCHPRRNEWTGPVNDGLAAKYLCLAAQARGQFRI